MVRQNVFVEILMFKPLQLLYFILVTRPGFAQVVEHIMGTNMFCLS